MLPLFDPLVFAVSKDTVFKLRVPVKEAAHVSVEVEDELSSDFTDL